jgi:hypothetical protein
MSAPDMKTPVELAAWLVFRELDCGTFEYGNDAFFGDYDTPGVADKAHGALEAGDLERAAEMLRECVRLASEPAPEIAEGRNRADRQRRAQAQRDRLLNVARIALCLLAQPDAKLATTAPAPTSDAKLIDAAEAAETFARALRAAAGMSAPEAA